MANNNSDKLTKGMRDGGSYKEPVWGAETEPALGAEGFSQYEVGDQVTAAAPAGEEGAHAIDVIVAAGNVEKHQSFSSTSDNEITGFER